MARYEPHDKFYRRARERGLPSRAAFKIEELIARFRLVREGARVVDLGCAPGGWLAILARAAGTGGHLVGVDLVSCAGAFPNVITMVGDIRDQAVREAVAERLEGAADLVTSDLAPKLSGIAARDQALSLELIEGAVEFARAALKPGGAIVVKLFMGSLFEQVRSMFEHNFRRIDIVRTKASRAGSAELYLVARDFHAAR
jgi:23S rRNA (uridine2552-2'-O)-methyltransferase